MTKDLFNEKYFKYAPSKKFLIILGICLVVTIGVSLLFRPSKKENFAGLNTTSSIPLSTENSSLADLVQRDTDSDGIADWEEALWGTDKTKNASFDNIPDLQYIQNKKKDLKIEQIKNDKVLTETDKFARQFFTAYSALKTSGEMDADAINQFSNNLGENIVDPNLVDKFSTNDIKISGTDDANTRRIYYLNIKKYFETYEKNGIGNELEIVSSGLAVYSNTGKTRSYEELNVIADAYQSFAKKVIDSFVPQSLVDYHLKIANSAYNTGISVRNMTKVVNDPIIGLSGVSQYKEYSGALIKAVAELKTVLLQ